MPRPGTLLAVAVSTPYPSAIQSSAVVGAVHEFIMHLSIAPAAPVVRKLPAAHAETRESASVVHVYVAVVAASVTTVQFAHCVSAVAVPVTVS